MKKLRILSLAALAAAAFNFTACDDSHTHDGPTATILAPTGMFNSGDSVTLEVLFEAEHELHEYLVTVTREHDDSVVQSFSGHEHVSSYTLLETFVVHTAEHSDFRVDASVTDHDGGSATETASFHVHPH